MDVQVTASAETWSWNPVAYAVSQVSTTWEIVAVAPRSTRSHCGSLNALDQRVPPLPSTAAEAGVPAFSTDEAATGRPCDSGRAAACARLGHPAPIHPAISVMTMPEGAGPPAQPPPHP